MLQTWAINSARPRFYLTKEDEQENVEEDIDNKFDGKQGGVANSNISDQA